MYQRFYGFQELPFDLTPNPKYLFFTKPHREALSNLQYGLFSAKSITLLIGEAGTGKTTLASRSIGFRSVPQCHMRLPQQPGAHAR